MRRASPSNSTVNIRGVGWLGAVPIRPHRAAIATSPRGAVDGASGQAQVGGTIKDGQPETDQQGKSQRDQKSNCCGDVLSPPNGVVQSWLEQTVGCIDAPDDNGVDDRPTEPAQLRRASTVDLCGRPPADAGRTPPSAGRGARRRSRA